MAAFTCPQCNSSQAFPLRDRPYEDSKIVIEVYISCTVCTFERVVRLSTAQLERLRRRLSRLEVDKEAQERKRGIANGVTKLSLARVKGAIRDEEARLRDDQRSRAADTPTA